MNKWFEILDWDSQFFNFRVAKVEKNVLRDSSKSWRLKELAENGVELAYYLSDEPMEDISNLYESNLIFKKAGIYKKLFCEIPLHKNIEKYNEQEPCEDLIELAYRAGNWSRFAMDPKIKKEKVKKLYRDWITKSVRKEMASEIIVYKRNDKILGMITLKWNPPHGQAPLFAVNKEAEGKGVSFALLKAADTVLFQNGCTFYDSATQAENRAAVTVFKRHGFEITNVDYFYHLWRKE